MMPGAAARGHPLPSPVTLSGVRGACGSGSPGTVVYGLNLWGSGGSDPAALSSGRGVDRVARGICSWLLPGVLLARVHGPCFVATGGGSGVPLPGAIAYEERGMSVVQYRPESLFQDGAGP